MANGLNLNGFGARAAAMGGAFVGLADDYTAVFWNPAGLTQLKKKTFGLTGDLIMPKGTYQTQGIWGPIDTQTLSKTYPAGLAGFFFPVTEKLTLGLAVFTPSGLGAEWPGADLKNITIMQSTLEWRSFIGQVSISPAVAYEISPAVSVGATLNINYGFFQISRYAGAVMIPVAPFIVDLGQYEEDSKGWGFGATFGLHVRPSEKFSFGLTFRTPTSVKMTGDATIAGVGGLGYQTKSEFDRDVTSPMWIAGGVAFKPIENLTITADAQYTNWGALDELDTEFKDNAWKAFMGQSGGDKLTLHWEDKTQLRVGIEYVISNIALRGGYYYDPAPAPDKTFNILIPQFNYNVITVGLGYASNGFAINGCFEYLMGADRDVEFYPPGSSWATAENMAGKHGMKIYTVILGVSYGW
jgi:long-chain fatty acid transport protein